MRKGFQKNIILSLILLFILSSCFSQDIKSKFLIDYISTKEGLSHNYVSQVLSDSLNMKWIASENGLIKYDGVGFTTIKPGKKYRGLKNENIETLYLDSKNKLWIGTKSGGLSLMDISTDKLTSFNNVLSKKENLRIRSIIEDNDGNIWIGTMENGLFVINPRTITLLKHYNFKQVLSLLRDRHNNIWVSTENIIKKFDPSEDKFYSYNLGEEVMEIRDVVEDTLRNCLWIGTATNRFYEEKPIYKFDLEKQIITKEETNISSYYFSSLYLDKDQNLWIGTWGQGLYKSKEDLNSFEKVDLVYPQEASRTINYDIILNIHEDSNGVFWIAVDFGGIVKLTKSKGFKNLTREMGGNSTANHLVIHSIYTDTNSVWLGTLRDGVWHGPNINSLFQVDATANSKISAISKINEVFAVGSSTQVLFFNESGEILATLDEIPKATIFFQNTKDELWIGTQQKGLFKVDIENITNPQILEQFVYGSDTNFLGSTRVTGITKDSSEKIWVSTYNGIYKYNAQTNRFFGKSDLFGSKIPYIINTMFNYDGKIWLGTPDGLFQLSTNDGKLIVLDHLTIENGLSNDFISGISAYKNKLWFTTLTNIVSYDYKKKSFLEFNLDDGIFTSQFNIRSIFQDHNGIIYAGGSDDITYFDPKEVSKPQDNYGQVLLTYLRVNNSVVHTNDTLFKEPILKKNISYSKSISLPSKAKSFAIGYSFSDFGNGFSPIYRYKLKGYQDEWININQQKEVNFVGLPPGNYELLISASQDAKNWSTPKALKIQIKHALLTSPVALFIYVILAISVASILLYIYLKQKQLKIKLRKDEELSEAKFNFFTNISHEFRTPLTLIVAPLKELMSSESLTPKQAENLSTIDKNSSRLLNLINQLLDFRKADHGLLKLRVSDGNFVRFSNEVFLYFQELANGKKIEYIFSKDQDDISFLFDRQKMEIVLCNLISNAFKYTNNGGKIILEIKENANYCILKVSDTGVGMNRDEMSKIFDPYFQIQSTNSSNIIGSGIGLTFTKKIVELHHGSIEVESIPDKGTEILIRLPMTSDFYTEVERDTKSRKTDQIENYQKLPLETQGLKIGNKKSSLLIIDDNEEIRKYLKNFLELDYNILEAKDGIEGVEVARKIGCDVILCDIMMPRQDGLSACKELKSDIITSHIPVILLTARSANMYEIKGLNTGADDFITKPFDPQIVRARIASVIENRSKLRKHYLNQVRFEPSVMESNSEDTESVFLQKIINAIEENLMNDDFGIETLTQISYMSQSTLYRKIKSLTGLSLTAFMRSIRLKKAAELILTEDSNLSEIALATGFNDYKYFRVSFVKQFGCLPSKYKSSLKQDNPLTKN